MPLKGMFSKYCVNCLEVDTFHALQSYECFHNKSTDCQGNFGLDISTFGQMGFFNKMIN